MFDPIEKLKEYVRHASVSADSKFADGMVGAQNFLTSLFKEIGFTVQAVPTPLHPVIVAKRVGNKGWPHVMIYGHYDVQPADPLEMWKSPPFEPTIKGNRMYGRGTADNKGPLLAHVAAVAQVLEKNPDLPLNIT
ncbi:MAG: M20/M25/M40 family metallo-hydrolase, partial [Candidatus Didemnitutus sp.]|nr:M20/M25/M40 family metallo-hydrolase [Candidatus Didemnitutus sp.]